METQNEIVVDAPDLVGSSLGLYDNRSANEDSVLAIKAIDVTAMCPNAARCVIKYARVTRGLIAQICQAYEKGSDLGLTVHWHINEMQAKDLAADPVFFRHATSMGVCYPYDLAVVIFANQPTN